MNHTIIPTVVPDLWTNVVEYWQICRSDGRLVGGVTVDRFGVIAAAKPGYPYTPIQGSIIDLDGDAA